VHKLARTKLTLEKRPETLRTLLSKTASEYKLLKSAGRVLDARIQVLRAKIGEMPSVKLTAQQKRRIAKLSGQIESLRGTTPMEILSEFRGSASEGRR
jgi:hypothetical protein